jgi:hypothetical protein
MFRKFTDLFFSQEEGWEMEFSITTSYFKIHSYQQFWWTELKALVIICEILRQTPFVKYEIMNYTTYEHLKKDETNSMSRKPTNLFIPTCLTSHNFIPTLSFKPTSTQLNTGDKFFIHVRLSNFRSKFVLIKEREGSWHKKLCKYPTFSKGSALLSFIRLWNRVLYSPIQ